VVDIAAGKALAVTPPGVPAVAALALLLLPE